MFCGILFVRGNAVLSEEGIRHEEIHAQQQKELWYLAFFIIYIGEWIANLIRYKFNQSKAYHNIRFELEAYDGQRDPSFLSNRRKFNWRNYEKE